MQIIPLHSQRIKLAKAAYTTHRVDFDRVATLLRGNITPQVGSLVLAKVSEVGHHTKIELATGRKSYLFPGDEIIVSYGNRYAPDQFEAVVPQDLSPCHLVAAGGLAAKVISQHNRIDIPTSIIPIGLLGDIEGRPLNLAQWSLPITNFIGNQPLILAVLGTSMNSGKTTTAAYLIKGLVEAGWRVGGAKVTGTGAGNDVGMMKDAGAFKVFDFTDVGFPSTYKITPKNIELIFATLANQLTNLHAEAIVIEIADGLYQEETANLLASSIFRRFVNGVVFATSNALGAAAGVKIIQDYEIPVLGISGKVTTSPLAMRETEKASDLPVFTPEMISAEAASIISYLPVSPIAISVS